MTPGLFYENSNHELTTKVEKNSPRFPTVIYTHSNGQRFRHYNFWKTTELVKLYSGQIAASQENKICICSDGIIPLS
jgi:hypothetical protein